MKQTNQKSESLAYQKIKANDKILQTLSELEEVLLKLYNPFQVTFPAKDLIYKDREGKEIIPECFYEDIQHFVDKNETMLKKDSQENYETIKKTNKMKTTKELLELLKRTANEKANEATVLRYKYPEPENQKFY
jgi:uncharacterized radical SAM superfamily Fe-S cluster-containing enzyme